MTLQHSLGHITHDNDSNRRTDYLYRISLKCLVKNSEGEVLVVKETGRDWWDLPGGGMDHGEDIKKTLAREMKEEVNMEGDFAYRIIAVDEPMYLEKHDFWQLRLIFEITPESMTFSAGDDGDEISFMKSEDLEYSEKETERRIRRYDLVSTSHEAVLL
jgi:8-oxo-dGTP pyrophosphatase MutT (NUDIX family)